MKKKIFTILLMFCIAFSGLPFINGSLSASAASYWKNVNAKATDNNVKVSWSKLTKKQQKKISGITVFRNGKPAKNLKKTATSYQDNKLEDGKYVYQIKTYKKTVKKVKKYWNKKTGEWQTKKIKGAKTKKVKETTYKYSNVSPKKTVIIKQSYTITWKNYDGKVLRADEVTPGETPSYEKTPTHPDDSAYAYYFTGWSPAIKRATSDATYTAQYEAVPLSSTFYTIVWKNWDGSELDTTSVREGAMPSYNKTPTRAEDSSYTYTFTGWNPTITKAFADAEYTAQFTKKAKPVTPAVSTGQAFTQKLKNAGYDVYELSSIDNATVNALYSKIMADEGVVLTIYAKDAKEAANRILALGEKLSTKNTYKVNPIPSHTFSNKDFGYTTKLGEKVDSSNISINKVNSLSVATLDDLGQISGVDGFYTLWIQPGFGEEWLQWQDWYATTYREKNEFREYDESRYGDMDYYLLDKELGICSENDYYVNSAAYWDDYDLFGFGYNSEGGWNKEFTVSDVYKNAYGEKGKSYSNLTEEERFKYLTFTVPFGKGLQAIPAAEPGVHTETDGILIDEGRDYLWYSYNTKDPNYLDDNKSAIDNINQMKNHKAVGQCWAYAKYTTELCKHVGIRAWEVKGPNHAICIAIVKNAQGKNIIYTVDDSFIRIISTASQLGMMKDATQKAMGSDWPF